MVRQIQGKIKGLKTDQFKKQPVIMDEEKKPDEPDTPEDKPEDKPEEGSEEQPSD